MLLHGFHGTLAEIVPGDPDDRFDLSDSAAFEARDPDGDPFIQLDAADVLIVDIGDGEARKDGPAETFGNEPDDGERVVALVFHAGHETRPFADRDQVVGEAGRGFPGKADEGLLGEVGERLGMRTVNEGSLRIHEGKRLLADRNEIDRILADP